jgi:type I restriction enzyme S subunit
VSRHHGIVSTAYGVYRARNTSEVNPYYLHELLRSSAFQWELQVRSKGVWISRLQLTDTAFLDAPIPLPPPDEQAAIARFLAWATNRLDRAIGAKRRIIALLQEQKQAIIHRAVTRGLDPSVPLKDSGIPWLGEIPEHWEVMGLRIRYTVELGKMLDAKRITGRYSIPYLRNRDVQWDRVLTVDLPVMDIPPGEIDRYTLQAGDLLVCEGGQVGRSAFWNEQLPVCGFQKALHRVRCLDGGNDYPRFFFYQMQLAAGLGVFTADGNENTIAHLTCEKLRIHRFAFPSLDEQTAIADLLDAKLQIFQNTISRLEREITLLREYRNCLIADVVTGKLDVREVAKGLPKEELQVQPDVAAGYDAEEAEDDAESDLIDTTKD